MTAYQGYQQKKAKLHYFIISRRISASKVATINIYGSNIDLLQKSMTDFSSNHSICYPFTNFLLFLLPF